MVSIHRVPRFSRKYETVYSYRAELLYGRRFAKKQAAKDKPTHWTGEPRKSISMIGRAVRSFI